jgi:hypothetical protein
LPDYGLQEEEALAFPSNLSKYRSSLDLLLKIFTVPCIGLLLVFDESYLLSLKLLLVDDCRSRF